MEFYELTNLLKQKWQTVTMFMVLFVLIATIVTVAQPRKYKAEQRFLILQEYSQDVDPYAASRSTEVLANLLSEVMYSQVFFDQVMGSSVTIDQTYFPNDAKKRQKEWKKTLNTRANGDTGILEVYIYHEDSYQATQLAQAVGTVLKSTHTNYHKRGEAVTIQGIDSVITSLRPVQPNIPLNIGAGALLGLILGLVWIYFLPEREFNLIPSKPKSLNGIRKPDWTKPLAEPTLSNLDSAITAKSQMYESANIKLPRGARRKRENNIGFNYMV